MCSIYIFIIEDLFFLSLKLPQTLSKTTLEFAETVIDCFPSLVSIYYKFIKKVGLFGLHVFQFKQIILKRNMDTH